MNDFNPARRPGDGTLPRDALSRTHLTIPENRITPREKPVPTSFEPTGVAPATPRVRGVGYAAVKSELHARLLDEIDERKLLEADDQALGDYVKGFV
ncbi:MAG: hypothetical protein ACK462_14380, partial [Planctomyces sp.]